MVTAATALCLEYAWAMPSRHTFTIRPIRDLLGEEIIGYYWVDPFAGFHSPADVTNDLNPHAPTTHHLDALDFLRTFGDGEVEGVLFDPPYSPRQVSECYKGVGLPVTTETTQARFWALLKDEIARIVRPGGACITCGWNANGIGASRGFTKTRILVCDHGGWHNATIVTVEVKS